MEQIKLAEALGYHSVWTAEAYGSDGDPPRIYCGPHGANKAGYWNHSLAGRAPAMAAMQAQTIDALAGGNRMIVGLGVPSPRL